MERTVGAKDQTHILLTARCEKTTYQIEKERVTKREHTYMHTSNGDNASIWNKILVESRLRIDYLVPGSGKPRSVSANRSASSNGRTSKRKRGEMPLPP